MFRIFRMFRRLSISLVLLFLLLPSIKATALEVTDLYEATIAVDSQRSAEREKVIGTALRSVFLKVGGKESALEHKLLTQAQKKPNPYVTQYRYQRKDEQLSLVVSFDENKVNALFKEAELPLWGSLRPQVLLWLIDEHGPTRSIVSYDANSMYPASVSDFSTQRGLPLTMPLMDLIDSEQVIVSDFWGYFPEKIEQASARYFADTIVVMRVSDSSLVRTDLIDENKREDNKLESLQAAQGVIDNIPCESVCGEQEDIIPVALDWKLYTQGTLYIQRYQGVDKVALVSQALSDITELIYQSYALAATTESDFVIEVNNVTSLTDDTQLFSFLADLSAVESVTLISAQENVRRFQLKLIGSRDSFLASLKLNNKLTQQIEPLIGNDYPPKQFARQDHHMGDLSRSHFMGMKVIVLGEKPSGSNDGENIKTPEILEQNVSTEQSDMHTTVKPDVQEDILGSVENNIEIMKVNSTVKKGKPSAGESLNDGIEEEVNESINGVITDGNDIEVLPSDDEQYNTMLEGKVPLTMAPNVPVFSWEQE